MIALRVAPLARLQLALGVLAHSIREGEGCGSETQPIGRVCGCGLRDNWNALAVEEKGSGGGRRLHHGPRVVMAPVMAASMAACG